MNTRKILLAGVCVICTPAVLRAAPSSSGFFAEVNFGGTYNRFNEQFRHNDVEKKDQVEFVKEHKNAFFVGANLGYGYELPCGFYVGAKVYGLYNTAEIEPKDNITSNIGKVFAFNTMYDHLKARPQLSYGAAIMIGGRMIPNLLVYGQCGFEGTYWKIEQRVIATGQNGNNSVVTALVNKANTALPEITIGSGTVRGTAEDGEEIKRNAFSIVPGIGAKYFFNSGMYVGVDAGVSIGIFREIEAKNIKGGKYEYKEPGEEWDDLDKEDMPSLSNSGKIYIGRNIAVRYGLSLGYKF